jgi:hypothetical protein
MNLNELVSMRCTCNGASETLLQADATAPNLRAQADSAEMGRAFRTARVTPIGAA